MKTKTKIILAVVLGLLAISIVLGVYFSSKGTFQQDCKENWLSIEKSCSSISDCTTYLVSQGVTEDTSKIVRCNSNVCEMVSFDCEGVSK